MESEGTCSGDNEIFKKGTLKGKQEIFGKRLDTTLNNGKKLIDGKKRLKKIRDDNSDNFDDDDGDDFKFIDNTPPDFVSKPITKQERGTYIFDEKEELPPSDDNNNSTIFWLF